MKTKSSFFFLPKSVMWVTRKPRLNFPSITGLTSLIQDKQTDRMLWWGLSPDTIPAKKKKKKNLQNLFQDPFSVT